MTSHLDWSDDDPRWEDEAGTVVVDPPPPPPPLPRPSPGPSRAGRWARVAGIVALAAPVLAVVAAATGGAGKGVVATPPGADGADPPPACPAVTTEPPTGEEDRQVVIVERPGRCPTPATYDRRRAVLEVGTRRYVLGEPGDWLLVGDWDCDGSATPALYRADAGLVFRFAGWAEDEAIEATERLQVDAGRRPHVERRGPCDHVALR